MLIRHGWITIYCFVFCIVLSICSVSAANAAIVGGNPKGKITIVELFDYECPHCQRMALILDQLIRQNKNVRVVYKVTPVLNQASWLLARTVVAAQYQKRALIFHHLLLASSPITKQDQLFYIAEKAGLNPQLLINTLYSPAVTAELQHNLADLQAIQAAGVPIILIGRTAASQPVFRFSGEVSLRTLQQAVLSVVPR